MSELISIKNRVGSAHLIHINYITKYFLTTENYITLRFEMEGSYTTRKYLDLINMNIFTGANVLEREEQDFTLTSPKYVIDIKQNSKRDVSLAPERDLVLELSSSKYCVLEVRFMTSISFDVRT